MLIKGFKVRYRIPHKSFPVFGGRLILFTTPEFDEYEATITELNEFNRLVEYCTKNNYPIEIMCILGNRWKLAPFDGDAVLMEKVDML